MRRFFLGLTFLFLVLPVVWGEDLKPLAPINPGDGGDILPPPLDLDQITPVTLPSAPATGLTPQAAAVLKAMDEAQAIPTKTPERTPTVMPLSTPIYTVATATPTLGMKKVEVSAPAPPQSASAGYFPAAKGDKWVYEYLKPAAGEKEKRTRSVECLSQTANADGSVSAVFQVAEDGKSVQEKYSIAADKVVHTFTDDRALAGDLVFQIPSKGAVARWIAGANYFKAVLGTAQVYQKKYPDSVIVTEKTRSSTVISYYARGIGLVAVEVYGKGLKLDQTLSFALTAGPAEATK